MKINIWLGSGALLGAMACAVAKPSPELVMAREAYQAAEEGPAKELNPADLHDAKVMLDNAEATGKEDGDSPVAVNLAYLALRRAELARAQGRTSAALREKEQAKLAAQAIKDKSLAQAQGDLAKAAVTQAQTQAELTQTQAQLGAEHQSRVEMHGQLAEAAATQERTQAQLGAEHQSRVEMHGQLAEAAATQERTQAQLEQSQAQTGAEHEGRLAAEQQALEALGKIAAVRQEARGMVISLSGSVLFASNKSALLPSAERQLDQVVAALKANTRTILIEGHSDSHGAAATNQALSQSRAQAVLDYLVPRGVQASRVRAVGVGASRPIADNGSAEGRANNRRVEIVLEPVR